MYFLSFIAIGSISLMIYNNNNLSCCLVCREVSRTLLGVGLVGFAAVAAFDGSVKTCFALGRTI